MKRLGLAVLAVALGACCPDAGPPIPNDFTVDPADPAFAADVDACFGNDAMCERLCSDLLGPPPVDSYRDITECFVNRRDDGLLAVHSTSTITEGCDF